MIEPCGEPSRPGDRRARTVSRRPPPRPARRPSILPDGTISEGWIGGGCARAAVLKAAREAIADGKARLVSVQPPDALQDQGVAAGEERAGVRFVKNMCPSQGTMDIFVEPVLPLSADCWSAASSPVAVAIADLGRRIGFALTVCAPPPSRRPSPRPSGASRATRCRWTTRRRVLS